MDAHSIKEADKVHDMTEAIKDDDHDNHSDVIVVDGRGYENNPLLEEEVYNLVDVVQDPSTDGGCLTISMQDWRLSSKKRSSMASGNSERIIRDEIKKLKEP
jgi:hypothetical protein